MKFKNKIFITLFLVIITNYIIMLIFDHNNIDSFFYWILGVCSCISIEIIFNFKNKREKYNLSMQSKKQKKFFDTFAEATLSNDKESLCDITYQRALENIKKRKNIDFNALVKEVRENNHVSS